MSHITWHACLDTGISNAFTPTNTNWCPVVLSLSVKTNCNVKHSQQITINCGNKSKTHQQPKQTPQTAKNKLSEKSPRRPHDNRPSTPTNVQQHETHGDKKTRTRDEATTSPQRPTKHVMSWRRVTFHAYACAQNEPN